MFKQQKGITLIALVITIIVLLILAGITIAMLTGSDSAPAKANEAKQKQDIGAAKDQIYVEVQNAQLTYYDNTYVKAGAVAASSTSLTQAKTAVGKYVADQVVSWNNKKVGDASIAVTAAIASTGVDGDYDTITITTRDYKVIGHVKGNGTLTWGDIVENNQ